VFLLAPGMLTKGNIIRTMAYASHEEISAQWTGTYVVIAIHNACES